MNIIETFKSWFNPKMGIAMESEMEFAMPEDWNDHEGWERFYAAIYATIGESEWIDDDIERLTLFENDLPGFVANLKAKEWLKVWVPGCGMSPIPKMLTEFGLEVHATDISPTAIEFQQARYNDNSSPPLCASETFEQQPGCFECSVQDLRSAYLENYFDLVVNVKTFSGFNKETMKKIAQSHHGSLKPGRQAAFVTLNVQEERLDIMEDCLVEAGFIIPQLELNRWYRQQLREAGISNIAATIAGMMDEHNRQCYVAITNEYQAKAKIESETEHKHLSLGVKLAMVYRLTG